MKTVSKELVKMIGEMELFVLIYSQFRLFYLIISLLFNFINYILSLLVIIISIKMVLLYNPLFWALNDLRNNLKYSIHKITN